MGYRSEEVEAGLDLGLGVVSLHSGGDHGDEPALGGHLNKTKAEIKSEETFQTCFQYKYSETWIYLVSVGHHRNVDITFSPDLLLRNDDLG